MILSGWISTCGRPASREQLRPVGEAVVEHHLLRAVARDRDALAPRRAVEQHADLERATRSWASSMTMCSYSMRLFWTNTPPYLTCMSRRKIASSSGSSAAPSGGSCSAGISTSRSALLRAPAHDRADVRVGPLVGRVLANRRADACSAVLSSSQSATTSRSDSFAARSTVPAAALIFGGRSLPRPSPTHLIIRSARTTGGMLANESHALTTSAPPALSPIRSCQLRAHVVELLARRDRRSCAARAGAS